MHRNQKVISIILAAVFVLFTFSAALAAPVAEGPCTADLYPGKISGTVVSVDVDPETHEATGLVTVDRGGDVLCTVNVTVDETHPITLLLGMYFGDVDANALVPGTPVEWTLESEGNLLQVSDQVANWHDQGMGFGVLVKLLAISEASGGTVTVDNLIVEMQGTGMGELFKKYGGKPDQTGVGHLRQEPNDQGTGNGWEKHQNPGNGNQPPDQDKKDNKAPKDKDNKVKKVCKSVTKGNGKGGGNCP